MRASWDWGRAAGGVEDVGRVAERARVVTRSNLAAVEIGVQGNEPGTGTADTIPVPGRTPSLGP